MSKARLSVAAALAAIAAVNAAEITVEQAGIAAESFVSADAIGSSVLSGRSVAGVSRRDGLWIVALAPSGHVIFSGSDLVEPVVGFSKNDFVEPDPESPAFAVLEGANASVATAEAQDGGTRHARWTKLLGDVKKSGLLRAGNPSSGAVVVEPFLAEHYNQWQPYNDYAPVHNSSTNVTAYRGRCPCGCVATASAQIFHHFKWPARIDSAISYNHVFKDDNGIGNSFPIRFDGHEPIYWNAISNEYAYSYRKGSKTCYDLRGGVDETVRYPIARLILWCDVLAHMDFESSGSGSSYDIIASNVSDWYTQGQWVDMSDGVEQVKNDILAGVPCQVSIEGYDQYGSEIGHEVIAHGWAEEGSTKYVYINFGWGGGNDGYYNINDNFQEYSEKKVYVGHYPRAKPQIDPLPAVSGTSLLLNWHFPDFYTNNLFGFTVSMYRTATTPSTFLDDFSASDGSSTSSDIYIETSGSDGWLYSDYAAGGVYSYSKSFTLTSASVLTFKVASYAAISATLEVQARYNGGSWQTISIPDLDEGFGSANWNVQRVYIGDHGGETAQFRIVRGWGGVYYIDDYGNREDYGYVLIDDFKVTEVLAALSPENKNVGKSARSCMFTELDAGSTCTFSVVPIMSGALVQAETSEPMTTSIVGERRTPVPGAQTYSSQNLVFSTTDTSGTWSNSGTSRSNTSIRDVWGNSITVNIAGMLSSTSKLLFSWKANCYYNSNSYDTFSAVLKCDDGTETTLWSKKNTSNKTSAQAVAVSLTDYAGKSGKIVISYSHSGSNYTDDTNGGTLSDAQVTNVLVPSVPAVAWETETLAALGTPEILSVSDVSEGFYGECWTNTTTFSVVCSGTVEALEARPSHLSLVGDNDVSVSKVGNGAFKVCVTPSGINESNFRSRMILTLVATDANGTKVYKDISLRFSQVEPRPTKVHVEATTSSGDEFSVEIPYAWIEDNGLAPSGSDAAAYEAAVSANADADSDGLPNWAEYVCGTSPTDPAEKLVAFITMVNGEPVVTYSPGDSQIADGFKAVIKGTTELSAALSTWEVVTETRTSTCRFFRVEIVPEN